jgi:isopenicillin N synthase-like dioxygenase
MTTGTVEAVDTTAFEDFDNRYLKNDAGFEVNRAALERLAVIDISPFLNDGSKTQRAEVAQQIRAACVDIGFFYATGHGFSVGEIDEAIKWAHRFFELPNDRKMDLHVSKTSAFLGYIGIGGSNPDANTDEGVDLREGFYLAREAYESEPKDLHIAGKSIWPDESDLPGYKPFMEAYIRKQCVLAQKLARAFAMALDLPQTYFDDAYRFPEVKLGFNYYPPVPAEKLHRSQWGISPHADYDGFTILAQDSLGGLQVRNSEGAWVEVPPIEGTFVINIGDLFATWTNDLFMSSLHRAINATPKRARVSIPFFTSPRLDTQINCLPTCTSADNPPKYEPIIAGPFLNHLVSERVRSGRNGYSARTMERFRRKAS